MYGKLKKTYRPKQRRLKRKSLKKKWMKWVGGGEGDDNAENKTKSVKATVISNAGPAVDETTNNDLLSEYAPQSANVAAVESQKAKLERLITEAKEKASHAEALSTQAVEAEGIATEAENAGGFGVFADQNADNAVDTRAAANKARAEANKAQDEADAAQDEADAAQDEADAAQRATAAADADATAADATAAAAAADDADAAGATTTGATTTAPADDADAAGATTTGATTTAPADAAAAAAAAATAAAVSAAATGTTTTGATTTASSQVVATPTSSTSPLGTSSSLIAEPASAAAPATSITKEAIGARNYDEIKDIAEKKKANDKILKNIEEINQAVITAKGKLQKLENKQNDSQANFQNLKNTLIKTTYDLNLFDKCIKDQEKLLLNEPADEGDNKKYRDYCTYAKEDIDSIFKNIQNIQNLKHAAPSSIVDQTKNEQPIVETNANADVPTATPQKGDQGLNDTYPGTMPTALPVLGAPVSAPNSGSNVYNIDAVQMIGLLDTYKDKIEKLRNQVASIEKGGNIVINVNNSGSASATGTTASSETSDYARQMINNLLPFIALF